jgi:DNA (cytosine-5)-methyltransferase 1
MNKNKLQLLSLFSGCGGLDLGFYNAGFEISAAIDNWEDALKTHSKNFPNTDIINCDLGNLDLSILKKYKNKIDVVVGGPPCQGFSISGKRDAKDPRNKLYEGFLEAVEYLNPKAFVMENVPNLVSIDKGKIKEKIIKDFENLNYVVVYKVLLASDFGVPQNRKRVFIVGIKKEKFIFPEPILNPSERISCLEALSDLPDKNLHDGSAYSMASTSPYQTKMRAKSRGIFNHILTQHDEKTVNTIKLVPDGGNYKSLPDELRNSRKVNIAWTRYASNKPSLTIDTGHRHHFHYKFNRVPTVRESARLQSFPDAFIFEGTKTSQYKQVGNAVPPILAEHIAKRLLRYLK